MADARKDLDNASYAIGWLAALPHERAAAEAMLDEKHAPPKHKHPTDDNIYTLGSIREQGGGDHNVVIASLPAGRYGVTPAAMAAAHMLSSFPAIKFGLMVGIGGGIPDVDGDGERDIRLGDVVVSQPSGSYGGVRQYDLGKATVDGFVETGTLNCPPRVLLNGVSALQGKHEIMESDIPRFLESMRHKYPLMTRPRQGPGYVYQGAENDRLFQADYRHEGGNDCRGCNPEKQIDREERYNHDPYVFYGTIASGNKVIKDPRKRELLRSAGCLCVETEAAGLMNDFPCLVIRGICDYCDSHKNDKWQKYAAATAAAYAKELLNNMDVTDVRTTPEARMIMSELRDLKSVTNDIASDLKQLNQSHQRKALYKWLTPVNSSARHSDHQKARAEDTGLWLLQDAIFQGWSSTLVTNTKQVLCCFGDPGVGKTILTSLVIDHLARRIATDPSSGLAYMYCDYRDSMHRKAENIIGSIIKQLLERLPQIPDTITQIHKRCIRDNRAMALEDARNMCSAAISQFSRVYICLDALDELAQAPLRDLMKCLWDEPSMRLYLTSRTHAQEIIGDFFENKHTIIVKAQEQDIRRFIVREIGGPNDVAPNAMDSKLKADIIATVVGSARGMFLLPVLQVRAILQAVSKRDREERLRTLPQDLGEAFAGSLSRIEQQANPLAELAKKVITWVHFGLQTFTVKMLKTILATREGDTEFDPRGEPDVEPLLACCHGLIVLGDGTSTIRLVHYSLHEFFIHQEEFFGLSRRQWHSALAATCLTFLFFPNPDVDEAEKYLQDSEHLKSNHDDSDGDKYDGGEDDTDESNGYEGDKAPKLNNHNYLPYSRTWGYGSRTVFDYAALNWGHHFRQSNELPGPAHKLARRYLQSSRDEIGPSLSKIENILYRDIYYVDEIKENLPFEVLGFFGLTKVGFDYWNRNLNAYHEEGDTALSIAARMGHKDLVALLIQKGAIINMTNSNSVGPIHHAIDNGHESVVRMLIEAGAKLNYDPGAPGDTPLRLAARRGHVEIVKYLIQRGAALDKVPKGGAKETALGCAAEEGHVEVVKVLLEAGATVDIGLFTPLCIAAGNGNEELVQLLISKGADLNRGSGHGKDETPLFAAASAGCERVVDILFGAGARVNLAVWNKVLYVAARGGHKGLVQLSIREGADIDCSIGSENDETALHAAARMNNVEMVRFLLNQGASSDPVDSKGDTPLLRALKFGKMKAATVLIKNGAMLERVNQYGLTPLLSATLSGTVEAVKLLIEEGAVVDLCAKFSPDYDEDDRDYRNYSEKDSLAIGGLARIIESSSAWAHEVRSERKRFINLLLRCSFFPYPCLATASCKQTEIFRPLVKESGKFPRGPKEINGLQAAILESWTIHRNPESEWEWQPTMRLFQGLVGVMEEVHWIGTFALGVCHELLNHESHASHSNEEVDKTLEIPSLLLGVKDVLDRLWLVAKRDILYNESVGIGTGLWALGDDEEDVESAFDACPSNISALGDFSSDEYGADDDTPDEDASDEFDEGGSDKYGADQYGTDEYGAEKYQADQSSSDAGVSDNFASDNASIDNPLRWRGWNMERLPAALEDYTSVLRAVRFVLEPCAQNTKSMMSDEPCQLAEKASTLIRVHTDYHDRLSTETNKLHELWNEKLQCDRWS